MTSVEGPAELLVELDDDEEDAELLVEPPVVEDEPELDELELELDVPELPLR